MSVIFTGQVTEVVLEALTVVSDTDTKDANDVNGRPACTVEIKEHFQVLWLQPIFSSVGR